jgi:hypothetical protein
MLVIVVNYIFGMLEVDSCLGSKMLCELYFVLLFEAKCMLLLGCVVINIFV